MKGAAFFAILPVLLVALLASGQAALGESDFGASQFVPKRFIIEVDDTKVQRRDIHPLDAVFHEFRARELPVKVGREYRADGIFTGASVVLENEDDIASLKDVPGVKTIRPVQMFDRPRLPKRHIVTGRDDPEVPPDLSTTHVIGGVDKVHAEGNDGQGIKIGILDTGIDSDHPAFGTKGIGPGKKIFAGYDFAGDKFDPQDPKPVPDDDPMDCEGHGTHVAGIIAMQPNNEWNVSGVAHGATIAAYKIFGCEGGTSEELIVDGLLQAVKDDVDILNLSLGGPGGWGISTSSIVANRIAASGKIVMIAAGNEGSSGSWYTSTPADAEHVFSIGSVDNTKIPLQNATVHGDTHDPITYFSGTPFNLTTTLPIYATSKNITVEDDACLPLPDDTPDLSSYLVLMRRGGCYFDDKATNAAAKGAKYGLIYDNGKGFIPILTANVTAVFIQAEDGEYLVNQVAAGKNISLSFPQKGASWELNDPNGGLMSDFSTYGPGYNFAFKPALSAPGGNIMSTLPLAKGGWGLLSGTSMATPYMAGVSALYLAAKGKSKGVTAGARDVFETTSTKIAISKDDAEKYQTLTQSGAGLINAYKAIHSTTLVTPGQLVLNDTANFKGSHNIDIQNNDKKPKVFKLTHIPAMTALSMKEDGLFPSLGPVPLIDAPAKVSLSSSSVTVKPGQKQTVDITFTAPSGVDKTRYPLYSGFIEVTSGSETYHVSYAGLAANLADHAIFDTSAKITKVPSPAVFDAQGKVQVEKKAYTFAGKDYPTIMFRLLMGTPHLRMDLVDPKIDFEPTIGRRMVGSLPWLRVDSESGVDAGKVKVVGTLFALDHLSRNDENVNPDPEKNTAYVSLPLKEPQYMNKTTIANAEYRILMRALKITGNINREEDFESWLSPVISVEHNR